MTANGATVLIAGATTERVDRVARRLDTSLSVRTTVIDDGATWPSIDADVVLYADGTAVEEPSPSLGTNVRKILVDAGASSDTARAFDSVLVEPLDPDELQVTVETLARQARYDRRLREWAELVAQYGDPESNGREPTGPRNLREQVADAKDELDGLVAQFSSDDFRRAFQTLAAD